MSKFNNKPISVVQRERTKNHEGGEMFKASDEMDLYSAVVTCMLSDKFYESAEDTQKRIKDLVKKVSPTFVAKLAVYAREKMYLRSIPLVLCCELAKIHKGDSLVSKMVSRVIQRPDELTEILACYSQANGREKSTKIKKLNKLSNQVRRGVAEAFNKFNEYQFAKYNRANEIKLRDALFLAHPKAKTLDQQVIFDKIAKDVLEVPYTWEVELSRAGQDGKSKQLVWEELIESGKVGYMALLRNLNNILDAGVSKKHLTIVGERIADEKEVVKSKQLPFRFLSAFIMINGLGEQMKSYRTRISTTSSNTGIAYLSDCIEKALVASIKNIPVFADEDILIASDVSGSMFQPISQKSIIMSFHIGLLLSAMMRYKCKFVNTSIFGDSVKKIRFDKDNIIANVINMAKREGEVGYSTNGYKVIEMAIADAKKGQTYDRIMMFTDCQMYGDSTIRKEWLKYKKLVPGCKLYLFNLSGYGGSNFSSLDKDVYTISGWSDKVFEIIKAYDGGSSVIEEINKIEL